MWLKTVWPRVGIRHVLIENPWNSAMWECPQSQKFFRDFLRDFPLDKAAMEPMECVKTDQCMPGLKDEIKHLSQLKPAGILTASNEVKRRLSTAMCDGMHMCQQLDTKKRCAAAHQWPRALCEQIIQGLMAELDYPRRTSAPWLLSPWPSWKKGLATKMRARTPASTAPSMPAMSRTIL